ncbi:DUF692 domain-containing protein [Cellvibrio sp. OA-2007]|uniref:DUF692 domain-containing protein n=1 Tax=Cellvibrio sp. OA-2007 TaxID=529823 RepID=UPI000A040055|nr:DUF692 family multinuclear iron-containing protein [Cellvibrio sp. OA-2007]
MLPQATAHPVNFSAPKLGVGINYHWDLHHLIQQNLGLIDYIEVSPDIFCEEILTGQERRFHLDGKKLQDALTLAQSCPVIVHGLGLSIGSASGWNSDYLALIDQYAQRQSFLWHSEHLGFTLAKNQDGSENHAGLLLPMPFTQEALDLLCPRINHLCKRYAVPFLIENTTYYLPQYSNTAESNITVWDEIDFLNQLLTHTECGLLLDLYNFYCNAVNFGFDPYAALARLQLERVIEIHVAGGVTHEGFLLDVHSSEVPEPVWQLLEWLLPKLPNLRAITYEVLEQALYVMGEEKIIAQIAQCKSLWAKYLHLMANSSSRQQNSGAQHHVAA